VVYHDDWCGLYQEPAQMCNCDPDVEVHPVPDGKETT
jgi:hypothetical protein